MVVYGDYECPFCAALEARLHELELRVTFRHFPVRSSHPRAQAAAHAAEAAALQGAFWPFHDALFAAGRVDAASFSRVLGELGLDRSQFHAALADGRHRRSVAADEAEGSRFGVRGTPTFFINGRVIGGAQPYPAFKTLIDDLLKQ